LLLGSIENYLLVQLNNLAIESLKS
jgi:hypothetical protein